MKTIILTLTIAGLFSTSLIKNVDLILKNHETTKKNSHFLENIDGKSRATKPRKKN